MYLNTIKAIYDKLTDNIILSNERLTYFPEDLEPDKGAYSHHSYST